MGYLIGILIVIGLIIGLIAVIIQWWFFTLPAIFLFIFFLFKWTYDGQESLTELESHLRSGDWKRASWETETLITLIVHRDCKKIRCVKNKDSLIVKFLFKYLNLRQIDAGIGIRLNNPEYFSTEEIEIFPIQKLQAIDNLWTKYSQGQFGFSVQASMYQQYGKTSHRSIRNDELKLNEVEDRNYFPVSTVKVSHIKDWSSTNFLDYIEKHEKDLLLKLGWMATAVDHNGLPVVFLSFSYHLDKSSQVSSTYLTPVKGMFPCGFSSSGSLCSSASFLLWRKLLRGSVMD